ncbi:F-box/FBD/LRR-repeat protein At5g53840-like [Camellia sinensis]|uniref:F-box domain-containing protein n=1 Tax=Camellia sinensis var. sinensis TaxID=542762 RepID=A0A4V3WL50_CAMSN|nr:F-box/FBD/LRR-repeat protein At5g53840-like [Camellia sinensis]THG03337.1 hypothetical protein TEA_011348 [Camellia sinensis var. sinensis]
MGKRMRGTRQKGACNSENQITELPNDLIAPILSWLTVKEALRTSIVAKQWRYLWTSVSALNFDANETLDTIVANPELRDVERSKYINFVNHVVKHHRGLTIDEFRICFDLDETSNDDIEGWVQFAMRKEVQWLVLDLSENGESTRKHSQNYTFPLRLVEGMQHCNFGFKSLKSLSLKWVNINGQVFEYLLSNCTALDHLSIYSSGDLVNVRVAGLSLKLKSLELVFCLGLEKIEICDTNLVSFTYLGPVISLYLNNVPMLKMLYIGEGDSGLKNDIFSQLLCCHSQLEFLALDMLHPERTMKLPSLPEFSNLKKLVLKIGARADDSLLQFTSLMIKACPYLDRFVLELIWKSPAKRRRKVGKAAQSPHQHLKLVEIIGYFGRSSDDEIVMYCFENAVALQKIVIDPHTEILKQNLSVMGQNKWEENARIRARKLESKKPRDVEFVIL